jgi:hypothetical protein
MRIPGLVATVAVLLAACGNDRPAADARPDAAPSVSQTEPSWSAVLRPGPEHRQVSGSATARALQGETEIAVEFFGGQPGAVHPWHVHQGTCGSDEGYLHEPDVYPPLELDQQGRGSARVTVPAAVQPGQSYFVNVHGMEDHDETVACGALSRN